MHSLAVAIPLGGAPDAAAPQPRLVKAAHEFEAQMMKELMKPMTRGNSLTGDDQDSDSGSGGISGSGGALGEFASEALGRALSDGGGFGIANRIVKDLSHSGNRAITGTVTANPHGNTVIRASK
jgi:Rod binding domain-containing protein